MRHAAQPGSARERGCGGARPWPQRPRQRLTAVPAPAAQLPRSPAPGQELYPGNYAPTPAHYFLRLLHDKGLLLRCFTQVGAGVGAVGECVVCVCVGRWGGVHVRCQGEGQGPLLLLLLRCFICARLCRRARCRQQAARPPALPLLPAALHPAAQQRLDVAAPPLRTRRSSGPSTTDTTVPAPP